jgi:putative cardiolipin synthase
MKLTKNWPLLVLALSLGALTVNVKAGEEDPFKVRRETSHDVILLNNGLASLEERIQMIERAEKSIDVEYFIYRTDKSAQIFTEALIKKAKEGVKVRMLLDYFMVKADLSPFYAHELEKFGIEIKYFNTTSSLNAFSGQYRNHRKILLIDGKEVVTGGRNIGDEYFDLHHEYNFLDREVYLQGEVVKDIETTFNQMWVTKLSEKVKRQERPDIHDNKYDRDGNTDEQAFKYDLSQWEKKVAAAKKFVEGMEDTQEAEIRAKGQEILATEYKTTCSSVEFHSEYPTIGTKNRKNSRIIKHDIFEKISTATKSVVIDSPYFIVNDELESALNKAFDNKNHVELLTNSLNSTDAIYVYTVFDSIIKPWIKKGMQSYILKGQRPTDYAVMEKYAGKARFGTHSKTFVFDEKDVVIGTYNVDPRSANFNAEMTVACDNNPELAAHVQANIDSRKEVSFHLDSDKKVQEVEFYETGFLKKITYYLLKGPSNWFDYLL